MTRDVFSTTVTWTVAVFKEEMRDVASAGTLTSPQVLIQISSTDEIETDRNFCMDQRNKHQKYIYLMTHPDADT